LSPWRVIINYFISDPAFSGKLLFNKILIFKSEVGIGSRFLQRNLPGLFTLMLSASYLFVSEGAGVFRPLNRYEFTEGFSPGEDNSGFLADMVCFCRTNENPVAKAL
jgi:hypothetical protein